MTGSARELMVAGAASLLSQRGIAATSFSSVLELTGAPRGSIYHHFPEGKNQLVREAMALAGRRADEYIASFVGADAPHVAAQFLGLWRALLEHREFADGCAVLAGAVSSDSPELQAVSGTIFTAWNDHLQNALVQGGLDEGAAHSAAALLIATAEGAVVVARATRSLDRFDVVAEAALAYVQSLYEASR